MANECLVTKLKGVVDNPNLPKLGYIKIHINNQNNSGICAFWCESTGNIEANIVGDTNAYFYKGTYSERTDQTTTISGISSTAGYRLSEGEYDIEIYSKYALTTLVIGEDGGACGCGFNFDDLQYTQLNRLMLKGLMDNQGPVTGKLSSIKNIVDVNFYAIGTNLEFTMKEYAQINMSIISLILSTNPMLNLEYFAFDTSKVSGAIEDLITYAPSVNYGADYRISASFMKTNVTFNGGHLDNTLRAKIAANGDGQIVKEVDSSVLATYVKSTNTWTYNV